MLLACGERGMSGVCEMCRGLCVIEIYVGVHRAGGQKDGKSWKAVGATKIY